MKLRYKRKGECKRCGKCCLTEDCKEYIYDEETQLAICKIFGSKKRPLRCRRHPQAPPILIEGCGYWFVDTWENNRKVKGVGKV